MRVLLKWIIRILIALILAIVVVAIWKREQVVRLGAVLTLFDEGRIVENFSHMDAAFKSVPLPRGDGPVSPLTQGAPATLPDDIDAWIDDRAVTSLLVMQGGAVVHESYYLDTGPDDRRISWSIAKSYLSALFGILVDEGAIASLDDPVTKYAPMLTGSAYDGASVRNVLMMSSGIVFDEDYHDRLSDINWMGYVLALGGTLDNFAAGFDQRFADPGEAWQYVSIDTHVVGMVARGATGRSVTDLLAQKVLAPLGLEQDGYYVTDGAGVAFVLGGLNFTTRDFARFGQMIEQDGAYGGQQVVPAAWIAESTRPSARTKPGKIGYGYQWWIPVGASEGEFMGYGVYGQYLYIDQARDVVIVVTGANRSFRKRGVHTGNIEMLRKIARGL